MSDHGFHPDHLRPQAIPASRPDRRSSIVTSASWRSGPGNQAGRTTAWGELPRYRADLARAIRPARGRRHGRQGVSAERSSKSRGADDPELGRGSRQRWPASAGHRLDPVASAKERWSNWWRWATSPEPDEKQREGRGRYIRELRYNLGGGVPGRRRHAEALGSVVSSHAPIPTSRGSPSIGWSLARRWAGR